MDRVLKLDVPLNVSPNTRCWISNIGEHQHIQNTYLMAGMMYDKVEVMVTFRHDGLLSVENVGDAIILMENKDMMPSPRLFQFDHAALNFQGGTIRLEIPVIPSSTNRVVMYRLTFFYESAYTVRITLESHAKI